MKKGIKKYVRKVKEEFCSVLLCLDAFCCVLLCFCCVLGFECWLSVLFFGSVFWLFPLAFVFWVLCFGVFYSVLVCFGVFWCVLLCSGVSWCVLLCFVASLLCFRFWFLALASNFGFSYSGFGFLAPGFGFWISILVFGSGSWVLVDFCCVFMCFLVCFCRFWWILVGFGMF